jgi:uncharacterized protein (DUF2164 family)
LNKEYLREEEPTEFDMMMDEFVEEMQGMMCPHCIAERLHKMYNQGFKDALELQRDILNNTLDDIEMMEEEED